jgi:hypothetical protein
LLRSKTEEVVGALRPTHPFPDCAINPSAGNFLLSPDDGRKAMAQVEKRFQTVLTVPRVWRSLLEIQSFDDLGAFLERRRRPEQIGLQMLTQADYSRPIQNDRREVSFAEEGYTVSLELMSGNEYYFALPSIVLPTGERYEQADVSRVIAPKVTLEIPGLAKYTWQQKMG